MKRYLSILLEFIWVPRAFQQIKDQKMKYVSIMTLLGLSMFFAIACSSTAEPEVIVQEVIKEAENWPNNASLQWLWGDTILVYVISESETHDLNL